MSATAPAIWNLISSTFVRARRSRAGEPDRAVALLAPLVAHDSNYAAAWAVLARAHRMQTSYSGVMRSAAVEEARRIIQAANEKTEAAARKAIELDPRSALAYSALAGLAKWTEAEDLYRQALALDPSDPDIPYSYSVFFRAIGRAKESLRASEQARELEPFVPIYAWSAAEMMPINGQSAATIPILEAIPPGEDNYSRNADLAKAYAAEGRFQEEADTLLAMQTVQISRQSIEDAARIIRSVPAITGAPNALLVIEGSLNFVHAYVGAGERVLECSEQFGNRHPCGVYLLVMGPLAYVRTQDGALQSLGTKGRPCRLLEGAGLA